MTPFQWNSSARKNLVQYSWTSIKQVFQSVPSQSCGVYEKSEPPALRQRAFANKGQRAEWRTGYFVQVLAATRQCGGHARGMRREAFTFWE